MRSGTRAGRMRLDASNCAEGAGVVVTAGNRADVIVVGAGVIGTACAYHLARRGARVLVLERSHLAAGASGATAGMIGASGGVPEPLYPLVVEGERLIVEAARDFDREPEIVKGGALLTAVSERGAKGLAYVAARDHKLGIESVILDADEARRLEPLFSDAVKGALHRPNAYQLNPFLLCRGYLEAAIRQGAAVRYGVSVKDVQIDGKGIRRVVTDDGDFECDWLINAAGAQSPEIMGSSGWALPVEPARGQIVITEAVGPLTRHTINSPGHLYIRQTARGNFLMGSHTEHVGFDKRITLEKPTTYARGLVRIMPMLARLKAIRIYAGWRPMSSDDLPILGPLPNCPRFVMATGHCRSGVIYSAVTGKLIAELLVDGTTQLPIDDFSIERFSQEAQAQ